MSRRSTCLIWQVLVEIAETHTRFLKKHIDACVNGMLSIAGNAALDDSLRHLALEFLLTVAENAPSMARKLPSFCAQTVQAPRDIAEIYRRDVSPRYIAEMYRRDISPR